MIGSALMHYRQLGRRYAVLFTAGQPGPLGEHVRFEHASVRLARTRWLPPTDVYESAHTIEITIGLGGIEPAELDIVLFEDTLVAGAPSGRHEPWTVLRQIHAPTAWLRCPRYADQGLIQ